MFTLENFKSGFLAATHNWLIDEEDDCLVFKKQCHPFDSSEDTSRIMGKIKLSELEYAQTLLESNYLCADTALFSDLSFEISVQPTEYQRFPLYKSDQELYSVSEHNYTLCISSASHLYLYALCCSLSQHPDKNYELGAAFFHAMRARNGEEFSSLEQLAEWGRILTVKIESPEKRSRAEFRHMLDSYLFNIAYNHNLTLSIRNFYDDERLFRRNTRRMGQLFPYRHYNLELSKYYYQAVATNIAFTQYLAFYHVVEFFFQSVSEQDTFEEMRNYLTRPSFSPHRENDIKGFYSMIRKKIREQRDDGVWNEKTALLLCLKKYVPDLMVLKQSILSLDSNSVSYYQANLVEFTTESKTINFNDEEDKVYSSIRDRVYSVRNAIVHSKDGDRLRYEPFKHDKQLSKEIPLIRAIAEEVIVNSAKPLDFV